MTKYYKPNIQLYTHMKLGLTVLHFPSNCFNVRFSLARSAGDTNNRMKQEGEKDSYPYASLSLSLSLPLPLSPATLTIDTRTHAHTGKIEKCFPSFTQT